MEIVRDSELGIDVVELLGPQARVVIPCKSVLPFLVMHIKDLSKFSSVEVAIVDATRRVRRISMSSKVSATRIDADRCTMPLLLDDNAWNYVCLNLSDITHTAFGVAFSFAKEIIVTSNMVLGRIFFTDKQYEDAELPVFLRVIP